MSDRKPTPSIFDPHEQVRDPDARTVAALERIARVVRAGLQSGASPLGLTPLQAQILAHLAAHRDVSAGALAAELEVSAPTVSEALGALERKGLVRRERAEDDRRVVAVALTPKGARTARRVAPWAEPFLDALRSLDPGLRREGLAFLLEFLAALERRGVVGAARMCRTCLYFREEAPGRFACALLGRPLEAAELRLDCPEHAAAGA